MKLHKGKIFLLEDDKFEQEEWSKKLAAKAVLILHRAEHKEAEVDLLDKILSAIGKNIKRDAEALRIDEEDKIRLGPALRDSAVQLILAFDCSPAQLSMNSSFVKYTPVSIGKRTFIFSDALSDLEKNKNLKIMLWNALKAAQSK